MSAGDAVANLLAAVLADEDRDERGGRSDAHGRDASRTALVGAASADASRSCVADAIAPADENNAGNDDVASDSQSGRGRPGRRGEQKYDNNASPKRLQQRRQRPQWQSDEVSALSSALTLTTSPPRLSPAAPVAEGAARPRARHEQRVAFEHGNLTHDNAGTTGSTDAHGAVDRQTDAKRATASSGTARNAQRAPSPEPARPPQEAMGGATPVHDWSGDTIVGGMGFGGGSGGNNGTKHSRRDNSLSTPSSPSYLSYTHPSASAGAAAAAVGAETLMCQREVAQLARSFQPSAESSASGAVSTAAGAASAASAASVASSAAGARGADASRPEPHPLMAAKQERKRVDARRFSGNLDDCNTRDGRRPSRGVNMPVYDAAAAQSGRQSAPAATATVENDELDSGDGAADNGGGASVNGALTRSSHRNRAERNGADNTLLTATSGVDGTTPEEAQNRRTSSGQQPPFLSSSSPAGPITMLARFGESNDVVTRASTMGRVIALLQSVLPIGLRFLAAGGSAFSSAHASAIASVRAADSGGAASSSSAPEAASWQRVVDILDRVRNALDRNVLFGAAFRRWRRHNFLAYTFIEYHAVYVVLLVGTSVSFALVHHLVTWLFSSMFLRLPIGVGACWGALRLAGLHQYVERAVASVVPSRLNEQLGAFSRHVLKRRLRDADERNGRRRRATNTDGASGIDDGGNDTEHDDDADQIRNVDKRGGAGAASDKHVRAVSDMSDTSDIDDGVGAVDNSDGSNGACAMHAPTRRVKSPTAEVPPPAPQTAVAEAAASFSSPLSMHPGDHVRRRDTCRGMQSAKGNRARSSRKRGAGRSDADSPVATSSTSSRRSSGDELPADGKIKLTPMQKFRRRFGMSS